jgi:hypothetical protein
MDCGCFNTKPRISLLDRKALSGTPSLCGYNHPLPHSSTPNCHWPPGWDFAGERARPGCRFRRRVAGRARHSVRAVFVNQKAFVATGGGQGIARPTNPNGIESFSPRLRGRATLGNRPTYFPTRNGLHHSPPTRMKPRWGFDFIRNATRRSSFLATPG